MNRVTRPQAEAGWRREALRVTCAMVEVGETDTAELDYAAADAGAGYIIDHVVRPLVEAVRRVDDLPPDVEELVQQAKNLY